MALPAKVGSEPLLLSRPSSFRAYAPSLARVKRDFLFSRQFAGRNSCGTFMREKISKLIPLAALLGVVEC
jgi:hypothetical protein